MVNKKALILTGVLAMGAAIALVVDRIHDRPVDARLGRTVLEGQVAPDIDKIEIAKSGGAGVTLVRGADNVWHLGEGGFPVDAGKVGRFIDDLTRATFQTVAGSAKDQGADFGLAVATTLALSSKGAPLLTIGLGDNRKGGGQYVTSGGDQVYLISNPIMAQLDNDQWEMKTLLDVAKDDVKVVAFSPQPGSGKKPVSMAREKKEEPLKVDGLKDPQAESPLVKTVDGQFANITYAKRLDPGNAEAVAALAKPNRAVLSLFDGRRYTFDVGSIGDKNKKYFLRIQGEAPESATPEAKARVQALNDLMAQNSFEVPPHVATRFEQGQADFVTSTPKG